MWCQFKMIYGTQVREFQRGSNLPTHISLELNIFFKQIISLDVNPRTFFFRNIKVKILSYSLAFFLSEAHQCISTKKKILAV